MQTITLTKGHATIVDDEDFIVLSTHKWKASIRSDGRVYAVRNYKEGGRKGKWHEIKMHRVIVNAPIGFVVDHINGQTLDNRKSNLRICKGADNSKNRRKNTKSSSRFKGVVFYKKTNVWVASIRKNGKRISLGYFNRDIDAALAYNTAAKLLFGEYASINDPSLLVGAVATKRTHRRDGSYNGNSKLLEENILYIRTTNESTIALSEKFGVSKSTIIRARSGNTWKQITEVLS